MRFLESVFLSFLTWIYAALVNALLGSVWLSYISNGYSYWPKTCGLIFLFTLLFSIPATLIFWIVMIINWKEHFLFRSLLKTACWVALTSSLLLYMLPASELMGQQLCLSLCILIASISAVMINHSAIKFFSPDKINHHA